MSLLAFARIPMLVLGGLWLPVTIALSEVIGAAASCLPEAFPEIARKNVLGDIPVGIFKLEWDSALLAAHVAQVLISEVVGYNVVYSGISDDSDAASLALSGCSQDKGGFRCLEGPLPDDHPHHAAFELWSPEQTQAAVQRLNPLRAAKMFDIGYRGGDGMFVSQAQLKRAQLERGVHLEYYSEMDARWKTPWDFFSSHTSINVTRLKPCAETIVSVPGKMGQVWQLTPDPAGFDEIGRAMCQDGYWWLSPACRGNASRCVPFITVGVWGIIDAMQRAIEFNLPISLGVAADWEQFTSLPFAFDVSVYSWEPAMHFLSKDLELVQFPRSDTEAHDAGDHRTAYTEVQLITIVGHRLRSMAPRVHDFISAVKFTSSDIKSLMQSMAKIGDYAAAACVWVQSTPKWRSWLPDEKMCSNGQGLVDRQGTFVESLANATSCAPCSSGHFSKELLDIATRGCRPCEVGTYQSLWGMDVCDKCALGYHQSGVGHSFCERCSKGTYSTVAGNELCTPCPAGLTTDGPGLTSGADCGCPPSTHLDSLGQVCLACGEGMICDGVGATPRAAVGYQLNKKGTEFCIFRCHQDERRCPGGALNVCASGRKGIACAECETGRVDASDGTCKLCQPWDSIVPVLTLIVFIMVVTAMYFMEVRRQSGQNTFDFAVLASVAQFSSVLQTMSAFSRMTIDWPGSARLFMKPFSALAFNVEWVSWGCIGDFGIMHRYAIRMMIVPCCIMYLIMVHVLVALYRCAREDSFQLFSRPLRFLSFTTLAPLQNSIGSFVMVFLVGITSSSLMPFLCQSNPSDVWTMVEYEAQICWQGSDHQLLIGFASCAFLMPISFFVYIIWITRRNVAQIAAGNMYVLQAHAFLYSRVRPQCLWFPTIVVIRNLCIATFPVLPEPFWQVFTELATILVYTMILIHAQPWRLALSSISDIAVSSLFCVILVCASAQVPRVDSRQIGTFVIVIILAVCVVSLLFLVVAVIQWGRPRNKRFFLFLCHHKQSAGALARLLNLHLTYILPKGRQVFLDADHLSQLNKLFKVVQHETDFLAVLMTSRLLQSQWCLGEITTAVSHRVPILVIQLPCFEQPQTNFADNMQVTRSSPLGENGLQTIEVQRAVSHILALERIDAKRRLSLSGLATLLSRITDAALLATVSQKPAPQRSSATAPTPEGSRAISGRRISQSKAPPPISLIIADGMVAESLASAMVLAKLLHIVLPEDLSHMPPPVLLDFNSEAPGDVFRMAQQGQSFLLLVCFTQACFRSFEFVLSMTCSSVLEYAVALPIVIPEDFHYPTKETFKILSLDVASLCSVAGWPDASDLVDKLAKTLFNNIACRLSVQSDRATLELQAKMVYQRISGDLAARQNATTVPPEATHSPILDKMSTDWEHVVHSYAAQVCQDNEEGEVPLVPIGTNIDWKPLPWRCEDKDASRIARL